MLHRKINIQRMKSFTEKELMDRAYQLGFEYEKTRHVCSQCVVAALEKIMGIEDEAIFQASYPLGGGLGSTTEGTCGALSGGAMILGYLFGRNRQEFDKGVSNKEATYFAKKLYEKFVQEYGSCRCKDVQMKLFGRSFDFWDEQDRKAFEEAGGHSDKCPVVVGKTCAWTVSVIRNQLLS
ncbi:C_GCAxxG_C_C family protein [Candidatus Aerophobetes bacterium]|nr:C_GCAxxG_C_C family protein [Candidatus Aerophobetes bacterium]